MRRHPTFAIYIVVQAERLPLALYLVCFAVLIVTLVTQIQHL